MARMPLVDWLFGGKNGSPKAMAPATTLPAHDYAVLMLSERDELDRRATYLHLEILQSAILCSQFGQARLEAFSGLDHVREVSPGLPYSPPGDGG